jgi:hypothetical protein
MGGRRGSPPAPRPHGMRHGIRQGRGKGEGERRADRRPHMAAREEVEDGPAVRWAERARWAAAG